MDIDGDSDGDMDSDGDSDGYDADFDADDDSDNTDYEYDDESGDAEMEFETEAEESADFDVEQDPDQDIEYDLSDQSVESTSTLWHADSNEQENWYYVESDQDDQPDNQPESENVTTVTEPMTAQQKQALEILQERSNLTVATASHNRDKREWYSRPDYYSDFDDEDDEDQDTPLKRINRLIEAIPRMFLIIPKEDDDE